MDLENDVDDSWVDIERCDECGSSGFCHPNCSFSDRSIRESSDPEGYEDV